MKEYVAETIKHKGLTIKIIGDQDAPNPRKDYDNAGTMVCWHSRYNLGDETRRDDPYDWMDSLAEDVNEGIIGRLDNALYERIVTTTGYSEAEAGEHIAQVARFKRLRAEAIRKILDKHYIMLPVRLYDHSGLSMSVGSTAYAEDPGGWDSGQIGWIYITKKKAVEEWGKKACTKKVIELAEKCLRGEVEVYDQYLTGDVYGYVIEDEEGEELDSLWGMFGFDYCKQEALEEAERQLADLAVEAMESAGDVPLGARP